ncbi:MAG: amino acid adenylation domain-containing protein, partial [Cyclobacteriaceae bacterium]
IDFLTTSEKDKLLGSFNDTSVEYPKDKTIVDLFEAQAAKTPDNVALVFGEKELTYKELDELSNRLAHFLVETYDLCPEDLIGIQLDRSEWVLISILGVLKSSGAYVPIDPEYPSSRKEYIANDASLKLLLTETGFIYDIDYYDGEILAIDVEFDPQEYSGESLTTDLSASNLAYVIYTSGSTGTPKGVMVDHESIVNTLNSQIEIFELNSERRGLQFASFSFDASISEAFIILLSGARLYIADESHRKNPSLLTAYIKDNQIDIATLSPSYLGKIAIDELVGLETLITAGESAHYETALAYLEHGTYYNAYGPTETSICGTVFKLEDGEGLTANNLPIGKPIANTQIYILSDTLSLQPIGVTGEICIGGEGLARGYLNRPDLTQEKFVDNPFRSGERMYRTGDLGRWLPDGNIEFIGRKDDQVKIRGYRIELGEIEHALSGHEQIGQAVVLAKENEAGDRELVAYLTASEEQHTGDLRSYLKERLPEYMLPAYFVQLEELPLTSNGKIDKKGLPSPEGLGLSSGVEYVAPVTVEQQVLVQVWTDVLKREGIGLKDSFYNLGGDSIKSIQVVARLKQRGYTLKVEQILRSPVLEELSFLMEQTTQLTDQSAVSGVVLLTPIQRWFFEAAEIALPHHYNQSVVLKSKAEIDSVVLEKSIAGLIRHHDALRMVYHQGENGWEQLNRGTESDGYTLDFYDLRSEENPFRR